MVEYSTDIYILRPVDASKGNHRLFFDINNRGESRALAQMNEATGKNDPTDATDAGNGFLMRATPSYGADGSDKSKANLTVRLRFEDPPMPVAASGWEYVDDRTIRLLPAGTPFRQGTLYALTYPARDPIVAGLGFAVTARWCRQGRRIWGFPTFPA